MKKKSSNRTIKHQNEVKVREISGFKFKEGILDEKTRHLVGLVASILAGCDS